MASVQPYRSPPAPASERPRNLALPPARMPGWHRGRPLKRWRYVGVFSPRLSLCVGKVEVGPLRQSFWAVWDRAAGKLTERTRLRGGAVSLEDGRVRVRDGAVLIDLALEEGGGVETLSPSGDSYIWTRKQGGVAVSGSVQIEGARHDLAARAIIDDSAGYHARHTRWRWSAGIGETADGEDLAWNLVAGIHDSAHDSERTLWLGGEPREIAPVDFADDLRGISFEGGAALGFESEAVRERSDNVLLVRSRYRQPFGTFAGEFPGGIALGFAHGVMEEHDARW